MAFLPNVCDGPFYNASIVFVKTMFMLLKSNQVSSLLKFWIYHPKILSEQKIQHIYLKKL